MVLGEADIIALIELLGYVDMGEEHVFIGEHYLELGYGAHQIETQVLHLQMLTMNEEDRKKQELLLKNREEYAAKRKADIEFKKQLEEASMRDRKEKALEKQKTSKGNQLNFGANLVKFEPPKESR